MPRMKQAAKRACTTKAAAVTAGLGLSLAGSASAMPTVDNPSFDDRSPNQRAVLGDEEMADVSLATFYLSDKENAGSNVQLAVVVVRGCRGCGGCRGCRGCAWRGCGGCGGCGGCCARWGRCRWC